MEKKEVNQIILEYKAQKYVDYVIAQGQYNLYHKFSDLIKMLDNGIACNMLTVEELRNIIANQDRLGKEILIAQFSKYLLKEE